MKRRRNSRERERPGSSGAARKGAFARGTDRERCACAAEAMQDSRCKAGRRLIAPFVAGARRYDMLASSEREKPGAGLSGAIKEEKGDVTEGQGRDRDRRK